MPQGVNIDFNANLIKFEKQLNKSVKDLNKWGDKAEKRANKVSAAFSKLRNLMKIGIAGFSVGAGIRSLNNLSAAVGESSAKLDTLGKSARRLGLSTDQLQNIRLQAEAAGLGIDTLDTAFQRFARRLGQGTLDKVFKELNISIKDSQGNIKSNFQLWQEFGRAVSTVEDENRQLALAMAAVDTEGVKVVELWRTSNSELAAINEKIKEYGLVFEENLIKKAEAYTTELGLIKQANEVADSRIHAALTRWSLDWEKLRLNITKAKFELLEYFGVFGTKGQTTEERAADAIREFKTLQEQRLRLTQIYQNAETEVERKSAEQRLKQNKIYIERNIKEREKLLAILEGKEQAQLGVAPDVGQGAKGTGETFDITEKERTKRLADQQKEAARAQKELDNLAKKEEQRLSDLKDHWDRLLDPTIEFKEQLKEIDEIYAEGSDKWFEATMRVHDAMDEALGVETELVEKTDELQQVWDDLGGTFSSAFEDAIVSSKGLSDIIKGLEQDIIRLITRELVTKPLAGAFTDISKNLFSGSGGLLSGLFPGKAEGGPVMAGSPYIVGEKGPELFVPKSNGSIVANGKAGATVNVYQTVQPGVNPEAYRKSARQGALEGSRLLQLGNGIA